VGLKLLFADYSNANALQQSHHCGIETDAEIFRTTYHLRSNRTIVGLKRQRYDLVVLKEDGQQSHHCGIETRGKFQFPLLGLSAAIAPLWD